MKIEFKKASLYVVLVIKLRAYYKKRINETKVKESRLKKVRGEIIASNPISSAPRTIKKESQVTHIKKVIKPYEQINHFT